MTSAVRADAVAVASSRLEDNLATTSLAAATCRNCGAIADHRYCPACGQGTALHPPSVREFVHEFVGHYVAFEGPLFTTLKALLWTPGRLTVDYFAGRRQRYIPPLRLYLTVSLILFAVAGLNGGVHFGNGEDTIEFGAQPNAPNAPTAPNAPNAPNAPTAPTAPTAPVASTAETRVTAPAASSADKSLLDRWVAKIGAMSPRERNDRVRDRIRRDLPYLLIVLVPVLALLLQIAYRRRGKLFGEHLVVAFHAQTVAFLCALVSTLPIGGWTGPVISLLLFAHGSIALRRVYGGRWVPTVARELLIMVTYALLVCGCVAAVSFVALVFS